MGENKLGRMGGEMRTDGGRRYEDGWGKKR